MKYRHIIALLGVSMPICVLLRVIQIIFTTDNTTGFIKQQYSQVSIMISVIVCAAAIAISVLASTVDDVCKKEKAINPFVSIAGLLAGGMFVYEAVVNVSILGFVGWNSISFVLSLLSACVFVMFGIKNIYDYKFFNLLLIVPVIHYVIKLINLFISTSALSLVTENVFMIFANSALLLFLYELACFENDFKNADVAPKRILIFGVLAVAMLLTTALPKIIAAVSQKTELTAGDISSALLLITQAIFILVYVHGNFYQKQPKAPKTASKHSL